jgi:hypothetical protein
MPKHYAMKTYGSLKVKIHLVTRFEFEVNRTIRPLYPEDRYLSVPGTGSWVSPQGSLALRERIRMQELGF